MKDHPILFSTEMVKAILEDRKKMTRRVIKPQPDDDGLWNDTDYPRSLQSDLKGWNGIVDSTGESREFKCNYGQPGDLIWVREEHYRYGHWEELPGIRTKTGRMKWKFVADSSEVLFEPPETFRKGRHHKDPYTPAWHKRLARFMPKSLCRIWLEITDIRVERLQDITEEDAMAEGIQYIVSDILRGYRDYSIKPKFIKEAIVDSAKQSFQSLWQSINGEESWDANPWVWCITFKRIKKPIMREIKFRGKRVDTGEWVYGSLLQSEIDVNENFVKCEIHERFADSFSIAKYNVIPKTVGQFIGQKDKKHKDIYEGHIVLANGYESILVHDFSDAREFISPIKKAVRRFEPRRSAYQVYWQNEFSQFSFMSLSNPKHSINTNINERDIEIIGNIYENENLINER